MTDSEWRTVHFNYRIPEGVDWDEMETPYHVEEWEETWWTSEGEWKRLALVEPESGEKVTNE